MIKTMKLKYVLLSGLFLSTAFVACTNDEFAEFSVPANTDGTIALGENYTISVAKVEADTKAIFNENLKPVWVEDDQIGAAWVHQVTKFDKDTYEVSECGPIGTEYKGLYSNHPFDLIEGAGTNDGKFKTVTNAFAGAYILYSPYNPDVKMTTGSIPVNIKKYEFDAKDVRKAISENMFSYAPVKFVPGGNQTGTFWLEQVPVLFSLRFTADEKLNMDLTKGGITIQNIVVEAYKGTITKLVSEGKVVTDKAPAKENYNKENGLSELVKYEAEKNANNLFITALNTNNDDYKLLEKGKATVKPFIFSALPFSDEVDRVVVKVVTDKGVYKKEYAGAANKKYLDEFNRAKEEGGQVSVNVILDVTEKDDVIYTAEEFMKRWKAACANKDGETLTIGTPLELAEALTCNDAKANVIIEGEKLTVPSMDLQAANGIEFKNELVVTGDVLATGETELIAADLTAKNVKIQGQADLTVRSIEELTITSSGDAELAGVADGGEIASVTIQEGKTVKGKMSLDATNLDIEGLTSNGEITLGANFTNEGEMEIKGIDAGSYTFTNKGTVHLNGTFNGTAEFINEAGAVLNVNANNTMKLTNNEADPTENLPAAIVNIAKESTLTGDATNVIANNGIINVSGKLTESANGGLVQTDDNARINAVTEEAVITLENTTALTNGYVMILADSNVEDVTGEPIAYIMNKADASVPSKATTIFVNYAAKASEIKGNATKDLVFSKDITLDEALTLSGKFIVAESITIKTTVEAGATLTLSTTANYNVVKAGKTLTVAKGVTIGDAGTKLYIENDAKVNAATGDSVNVTIEGK